MTSCNLQEVIRLREFDFTLKVSKALFLFVKGGFVIYVHCGCYISVSHNLLNNFYVSFIFTETSAKCILLVKIRVSFYKKPIREYLEFQLHLWQLFFCPSIVYNIPRSYRALQVVVCQTERHAFWRQQYLLFAFGEY